MQPGHDALITPELGSKAAQSQSCQAWKAFTCKPELRALLMRDGIWWLLPEFSMHYCPFSLRWGYAPDGTR